MQMNLMLGDIPQLLDLIFTWISPPEDENVFRYYIQFVIINQLRFHLMMIFFPF